MLPSPGPSAPGATRSLPGIVVVGVGSEASFRGADGPTELAARRFARTLSLPHRVITDPMTPHRQLRQLQELAGGWLASLPLDPGQALEDGSTWAEALGAWQQPTLLIIGAQQLHSGAAASTAALLRQWRVPSLGLLQWGGSWKAEQRRRDGLPWLGRLEDAPAVEGHDSTGDLARVVLRRLALLDLPGPLPHGEPQGSTPQI
jgi:hypothetical protein